MHLPDFQKLLLDWESVLKMEFAEKEVVFQRICYLYNYQIKQVYANEKTG